MTRILDERDKKELHENMQAQDELLSQRIEVANNDIKELNEEMQLQDLLLRQYIEAVDSELSNDIQELADDTNTKITNLDNKVADNLATLEQDMTNRVDTLEQDVSADMTALEQNMTTQIETVEQDMTTKINTLEQNTNTQISDLEDSVSTQFTDLEQDVDSQISTLSQDMTTQINALDESMTSQINDLDSTKVDKDGDKVLSENDLTDELKENYDTSYEHSQQAHAPSDAEMNVQANWAEEDTTSDAYIQNKPTLGTMAAKNVIEKSDLSVDVQVSLGLADTALQSYEETDPTVPSWAKQPEKPAYTADEVGALPDTTVALKNPNSIVFTGATDASYDGSSEITVNIPVLPAITSEDEGKVLCVVNGVFSLVSITDLIPNEEEPVS